MNVNGVSAVMIWHPAQGVPCLSTEVMVLWTLAQRFLQIHVHCFSNTASVFLVSSCLMFFAS